MAKIACPAKDRVSVTPIQKEVRTRMHFRPGLFRIGVGSCEKHSSLFLLFHIYSPARSGFQNHFLHILNYIP